MKNKSDAWNLMDYIRILLLVKYFDACKSCKIERIWRIETFYKILAQFFPVTFFFPINIFLIESLRTGVIFVSNLENVIFKICM